MVAVGYGAIVLKEGVTPVGLWVRFASPERRGDCPSALKPPNSALNPKPKDSVGAIVALTHDDLETRPRPLAKVRRMIEFYKVGKFMDYDVIDQLVI